MKKSFLVIGILVIAAVAGWFLLSQNNGGQNSIPQSGTQTKENRQTQSDFNKVPEFRLQDYSGKTVSLADFAGKPLVINSWAAWCPFCRKELVDFAVAQQEFGDKVVIIAVDRAEAHDTAKKYTDEIGVTNDMVFLLDPSDDFYQSIGGFSMPETIFIDANGIIVFHKRGPMDIQEMREKIQQLISQ